MFSLSLGDLHLESYNGVPKPHREGVPLRPVLNTKGTFNNYNLVKFFDPIIELLTTNQYTLRKSFDFVDDVKKVNMHSKIIANFVVQSLFNNIPLIETIYIITSKVSSDLPTFTNFTKKQFKVLF